jgi:hypothetical protein
MATATAAVGDNLINCGANDQRVVRSDALGWMLTRTDVTNAEVAGLSRKRQGS